MNNFKNEESNINQKKILVSAIIIFLIAIFAIVAVYPTVKFKNTLNARAIQTTEVSDEYIESYGLGGEDVGEHVVLTNDNAIECIDEIVKDGGECIGIYPENNYKPGLYTVVYTPISFTDDDEYSDGISFKLALNGYLDFDLKNPNKMYKYRKFNKFTETTIIENVPLYNDSQIILYYPPKNLEFTVELIPQTHYKKFENGTEATGFYPVDLTVERGNYTNEYCTSNPRYPYSSVTTHDDDVWEMDMTVQRTRDDISFTLEPTDIFVSYTPNICIEDA